MLSSRTFTLSYATECSYKIEIQHNGHGIWRSTELFYGLRTTLYLKYFQLFRLWQSIQFHKQENVASLVIRRNKLWRFAPVSSHWFILVYQLIYWFLSWQAKQCWNISISVNLLVDESRERGIYWESTLLNCSWHAFQTSFDHQWKEYDPIQKQFFAWLDMWMRSSEIWCKSTATHLLDQHETQESELWFFILAQIETTGRYEGHAEKVNYFLKTENTNLRVSNKNLPTWQPIADTLEGGRKKQEVKQNLENVVPHKYIYLGDDLGDTLIWNRLNFLKALR